jgi:hypothetical protein
MNRHLPFLAAAATLALLLGPAGVMAKPKPLPTTNASESACIALAAASANGANNPNCGETTPPPCDPINDPDCD